MSHHRQNEQRNADATPPPGCEFFEQTLSLIDGLLEGDAQARAARHSTSCATCEPMVTGWASVSDALFATFEDAAEAAKPDFGAMTNRIIERAFPIDSGVNESSPTGAFARLVERARSAQAWILLGATALALVLVVPSFMKTTTKSLGTDTRTVAALATDPEPAAPSEETPPPVMVVRDLSFGTESNGMVYRTPRGGMTVIWVTENEGA